MSTAAAYGKSMYERFAPAPPSSAMDDLMRGLVAAVAAAFTIFAIAAFVAVLYVIKSKLGINLMRGHSPLHGLLSQFVR